MLKIAIIRFPGLNTEYETRREIARAGMRGDFFRWNDDPKKLEKYDGYVIGGGFSYEDRGRAGVIASLDPIMEEIKKQAAEGKPVLGICNGAQIILESGLIPGVDSEKLVMALARNKRIRDGEVLGTGYYNAWTNLKCTAPEKSCMFTLNMRHGEILHAPVAHGEGRFTTEIAGLMQTLASRGQIALRYCDRGGVMTENFPINPNGAQFNAAAICNPAGNVMAVMPHLERNSIASEKLFSSLRDALTDRKAGGLNKRVSHLAIKPIPVWPIAPFAQNPKNLQLFISLIITDNEAETFGMTIKNLGLENVSLRRQTHISLSYKGRIDIPKLMKKLIQSGVLMNTNKETAVLQAGKSKTVFDAKREKFVDSEKNAPEIREAKLLVREKPDFVGMSKLATIQKRLKMEEITELHTGTLWGISIDTKSEKVRGDTLKKLVATNIFFNPHGQEAFIFPE